MRLYRPLNMDLPLQGLFPGTLPGRFLGRSHLETWPLGALPAVRQAPARRVKGMRVGAIRFEVRFEPLCRFEIPSRHSQATPADPRKLLWAPRCCSPVRSPRCGDDAAGWGRRLEMSEKKRLTPRFGGRQTPRFARGGAAPRGSAGDDDAVEDGAVDAVDAVDAVSLTLEDGAVSPDVYHEPLFQLSPRGAARWQEKAAPGSPRAPRRQPFANREPPFARRESVDGNRLRSASHAHARQQRRYAAQSEILLRAVNAGSEFSARPRAASACDADRAPPAADRRRKTVGDAPLGDLFDDSSDSSDDAIYPPRHAHPLDDAHPRFDDDADSSDDAIYPSRHAHPRQRPPR
mmetsp:Transcript_17239/g.59867  ORF Transcript_17239/g.59867 Transcript_17239/m.59867 type:complete len:347 (+) Transcript_17239:86-1126(+)